ncbi:uncharacterized protein LOC112570486 [Pomacea canaliculata]|uniref:uncharacterized protein LOC112570486 n=1 Tax=Pomacea canaliculata TaxID=400727 RepID=UPI000D72B3E6|nr:uncharacterized protein LOC112570486 [Pomacea canaliculata]
MRMSVVTSAALWVGVLASVTRHASCTQTSSSALVDVGLEPLESQDAFGRRLRYVREFGDFIRKDDWILVFRAAAGIAQPVYDTWTRVGYHDDYQLTRATMPCGCTRTSGSCDRHYRSRLLDSWPSRAIDKVKMALYENGNETAYMIFSGHGTSYMDWFSANRLVESSWTDLKSASHDFFSIVGLQHSVVYRRFYISNRNIHCPDDIGWLNIKDRANSCSWEASSQIPVFVYSKAKTMINWQNAGSLRGFADVMAVWVKLDKSFNLMQTCLP